MMREEDEKEEEASSDETTVKVIAYEDFKVRSMECRDYETIYVRSRRFEYLLNSYCYLGRLSYSVFFYLRIPYTYMYSSTNQLTG